MCRLGIHVHGLGVPPLSMSDSVVRGQRVQLSDILSDHGTRGRISSQKNTPITSSILDARYTHFASSIHTNVVFG